MRLLEYIKRIFISIIFAFSFMTRLPVHIKAEIDKNIIRNSVTFFPLTGLVFGLVSYFTAKYLIYLNIKPVLTAAIIVALNYSLNRFLHFDGLCDVLDAFLSDKDSEKRLTIMKDSNIGSFALGGGVLYLILKLLIITIIVESGLIYYLIIIPVFSRCGIVFLCFKTIYPRDNGTGSIFIGKINIYQLMASIFVTVLIVFSHLFFFRGMSGIILLMLFLILLSFLFIWKFYSYKKIGGITGDVLGASVELNELLLMTSLLIIKYLFR